MVVGENIGEVIASNTSASQAVGTKQDPMEDIEVCLGQLIKIRTTQEQEVFGIVSFIEHAALDSSRLVTPLGKSREELQKEMPQVFELIQTIVHTIHVGYNTNNSFVQGLPLQPPRLHDFVYETTTLEQQQFFESSPQFIRLIINAKNPHTDELIVAFLRQYKTYLKKDSLVKIGKELSYFFSDDHRRLESLLERI